MTNASLVGLGVRQPPAPFAALSGAQLEQAQRAWVPWHLDRIDQRNPQLDGRFTATATGSGVNVYIVSSGVHAEHAELRSMDSASESRVMPAFGYLGE